MCKPINCPVCFADTYHKGWCENSDCGFSPGEALVSSVDDRTLDEIDAIFAGLVHVVRTKPFPLVRFQHDNLDVIEELATVLGYDGQVYEHPAGVDLLDLGYYGLDIVREPAADLIGRS